MSKITDLKNKLQKSAPDNVIINYIGKLNEKIFFIIDYKKDVGFVGIPRIIEANINDTENVTVHCNIEIYKSLAEKFPNKFQDNE